jgi:hypothetical protein
MALLYTNPNTITVKTYKVLKATNKCDEEIAIAILKNPELLLYQKLAVEIGAHNKANSILIVLTIVSSNNIDPSDEVKRLV